MVNWIRTVQANLPWTSGTSLIGSIPRGSTLLRIRFGWGFYGSSSSFQAASTIAENLQVFGIVTLDGTGGGPAPNPRTASNDPAPPLERWLWWEARPPVITAYDSAGGVTLWQDGQPSEVTDGKGMVAGNVAAGHTLDVWASWAAAAAWADTTSFVHVWYWASVAYQ